MTRQQAPKQVRQGRFVRRASFSRCSASAVAAVLCAALWCASRDTAVAAEPGAGPSPPSFEQVCFDDFYESQGFADEAPLRELLAEVPGVRGRISKTRRHDRPICQVSGVLRLRKPWTAGSALRVSLVEAQTYQLHLWRGKRGVTLRFYATPFKVWAAYGTTRDGGKPQPDRRVLWATDNGRYRRAGTGTFELHWAEGSLVMTRGDVRLLTVPLESLPSEVYLEGTAQVCGLDLVPVAGLPAEPGAKSAERLKVDLNGPDWEIRPESGFLLEKLADGGVHFAAAEKTPDGQAAITVCRPGLYEFVLEVEDPQPGSGVLFGDAAGKPLGRLAFFRDNGTGRTTFGMLRPDGRDVAKSYDENRLPIPYVGHRHWLRVVAGAGLMKVWTSGDGLHWSQPEPAVVELTGGVCQVGLYCLADQKPRAIRLRSLEFRELEAITSLVPEVLRKRLALRWREAGSGDEGPLARSPSVEKWEERVAKSCPADVSPRTWRRACILHTLGEGPGLPSSALLLEGLVKEALPECGDLDRQLRLLDEAVLLCNCPDWAAVDRWASAYELVGRTLEDRAQVDPFPAVQRRMVCSPFWAERAFPAVPERLLWHDLVRRVSEDRWLDAAALCRRLRYQGRPEKLARRGPPWSVPADHLISTMEERASHRVKTPAPDRSANPQLDYRHPLIENWSKEGYNVKTEFQAAMEGQRYRDACQIITSSTPAAMEGLLPDAKDPRLLASLPVVIERAVEEVPELRRAMQDHLGPLGGLRLKQATAGGDVAAVEAIAVQFFGSEAGAGADRWLGDRQLAGGRPAQAVGHYRRALRSASPSQRNDLIGRLQLARAMRGDEGGSPLEGPVEVGGHRFSAAEFGRLLDEMHKTHRRPAGQVPGASGAGCCPAPGRYGVRAWARVEGAGCAKPDHLSSAELDWAGRETAAAVTGGQMIVSNCSEHVSFDLGSGRRLWYHRQSGSSGSRPWPPMPGRPVPGLGRVFIRRQVQGKPELACLDPADGRLLWSSTARDYVASDALIVGREVYALSVDRTEGRKVTVFLTLFDVGSGRPVRQVPLVEFRGFLDRLVPCRAVVADDKILATLGGTVLCCDLSGRLRWLRRAAWIAPRGHSMYDSKPWLEQIATRPLVAGDRVYATQPGTWSIECLDLHTGRLAWRTTLSGLTGLLGLVEERLIAGTDEGLLGLDPQSGRVLWRHDARDLLEGRLCGAPGGILYSQRQPSEDPGRKEPQVALVWLDPATGKRKGQSILETPRHAKPLLGPLVAEGKRFWALFGVADDTARREVVELVPAEGNLGVR